VKDGNPTILYTKETREFRSVWPQSWVSSGSDASGINLDQSCDYWPGTHRLSTNPSCKCSGVTRYASHERDRARLAPVSALLTNSIEQRSRVNGSPCYGDTVGESGCIRICSKRHIFRSPCALCSLGTVATYLKFDTLRVVL
jgi:hypothetical protein